MERERKTFITNCFFLLFVVKRKTMKHMNKRKKRKREKKKKKMRK